MIRQELVDEYVNCTKAWWDAQKRKDFPEEERLFKRLDDIWDSLTYEEHEYINKIP